MEDHGYSVIRALGQGGCNNRVYEVRSADGQTRVVKQLPWVGEKDREHALLEVRLLASLRHPCIVHYIETFLVRSTPSMPTEDILCLVMSRCERDLRQECLRLRMEAELLQEEPPPQSGETDQQRPPTARFPESTILTWLAQLCWGLQHLHSRKFLHRDLKPQNVLMSHGSTRVLLADFGIAAQVESTEGLRSSIVGTPAFMSPEMLEGRPYGLKTDQWALGCVLFEMMALEPPFAGKKESYAAVVTAVLHAPPIRAPFGFSPELGKTMEALLARKPHDRPSNRDLLRGPVLREPFQAFVQSLQGELRAATGPPVPSPTPEPEAPPHSLFIPGHGAQGSPNDSLHLPSVGASPARSSSTIGAGFGGAELGVPECTEEVASYASDFTSLSGEEEDTGAEVLAADSAGNLGAGPALPPMRVAEVSTPADEKRGLGLLGHRSSLGSNSARSLAPPGAARFSATGDHLPLLRDDQQERPRGKMSREVGLPPPTLAPPLPPCAPASSASSAPWSPGLAEADMEVEMARWGVDAMPLKRSWLSREASLGPAEASRAPPWSVEDSRTPSPRESATSGGWMQGPPGRALRHHGAAPAPESARNTSAQFSWCGSGQELESSGSGGITAMAASAMEGLCSTNLALSPAMRTHRPQATAAAVGLPAVGLNLPADVCFSYAELAGGCAASEFGASEWRLLLDEAESLLQSPAEPTGGFEEAQKIRTALAAMLGAPAQVDKALIFLRKRKPLGDTVEADELLLQVELLDLLGEEALHTLPLLEKLQALESQALEANATWVQRDQSPELPSMWD